MFDPITFKCDRRCGECCIKLIVKLSNADIKRIKSLGYDDEDFVETDVFIPGPSKYVMKKLDNSWCVFLKKNKKGEYGCKIYNQRPKVCQDYPFTKKGLVDDCKPKMFADYLKGRLNK